LRHHLGCSYVSYYSTAQSHPVAITRLKGMVRYDRSKKWLDHSLRIPLESTYKGRLSRRVVPNYARSLPPFGFRGIQLSTFNQRTGGFQVPRQKRSIEAGIGKRFV
jgi:hypothetical protein